jgi:hypothetical protein
MLYQLSHVRMPVPRTPGTSTGSLRRCVRTVSDPGATTNSEPEVGEKICNSNGPWLLPPHHYPCSAADHHPAQPPTTTPLSGDHHPSQTVDHHPLCRRSHPPPPRPPPPPPPPPPTTPPSRQSQQRQRNQGQLTSPDNSKMRNAEGGRFRHAPLTFHRGYRELPRVRSGKSFWRHPNRQYVWRARRQSPRCWRRISGEILRLRRQCRGH